MKRYDLITPEGTKDLILEDCIARKKAEETINGIFEKMGYVRAITPALEFYDVFNLNSNYFPQEGLYKLFDSKGRILVLRPDSTMPIARVVATRLKDARMPLRMYYNQSVFATNSSFKGKSDEIAQAGIELIGSSSEKADCEVLAAAVEVLKACSGGNFRLEIGDSGYFKELVRHLPTTDDVREEIRRLIETKNYPALNDLLDSLGKTEITEALKQLPRLFGGEEVFERAKKLYSDERIKEILTYLRKVYRTIVKLDGGDNNSITVDLGIVNRADYYTGVIMKGYLHGCGDEVLSGGRYDKLIREFGADLPATGFAVNIDAVAAVMKRSGIDMPKIDCVIFADNEHISDGIIAAQKLRNDGKTVSFSTFDTLEETKANAPEDAEIIICGGNENE